MIQFAILSVFSSKLDTQKFIKKMYVNPVKFFFNFLKEHFVKIVLISKKGHF